MTEADETVVDDQAPSVDRYIEYMPLDDLLTAPKNPKAHDLDTIGDSLDRFGVIETIVIDERTGQLISGHGRMEKLGQLEGAYQAQVDAGVEPDTEVPEGVRIADDGTWRIPVTRGWASADDAEAEAALVAVNAIGEGRWDRPVLFEILDRQKGNLTGIGYDAGAVQTLARDIGELARRNTNFLGEFGATVPGLGQSGGEQNHDGKTHLAGTGKVADPRVVMEFPMTADERREVTDLLGKVKIERELETFSAALLEVCRTWASAD